MSPNADGRPTVLVVDDEPEVADSHALALRERYETRTAYGGAEALEAMDEDVDAVLLDRRMPHVHGDDVLAELRDRGYDCPVIMITAVDPDLNILEMDFDDYLCKPVFGETLLETLDQHLESRGAQDPRLEEFFRLVSKLQVLEEGHTRAELAESEEYAELTARAEELGNALDEDVADFDELVDTFREINRE